MLTMNLRPILLLLALPVLAAQDPDAPSAQANSRAAPSMTASAIG